MQRSLLAGLVLVVPCLAASTGRGAEAPLKVGFAATDITPTLGAEPVYMAGFGNDRKARRAHDALHARAVVLAHAGHKVALVSIDLIGFFHPNVQRVRAALPGFTYVLVSSTHNHEGPDTLGLWGPSRVRSGVDAKYLERVEKQIVQAVRAADRACKPATARIGTTHAPELLHDAREPYVKHDELVALAFLKAEGGADGGKPAGLVVQWNCHPETLGSGNTEISADFAGYTVRYLQAKYHCPVVYLTGTVGGLMTSLHVPIKDAKGTLLRDGTFEKTQRYGELVGERADQALKAGRAIKLTPLHVRQRTVFLPIDNKLYLLARQLGVFQRDGFLWKGDPYRADPAPANEVTRPLCIRSEITWLHLGQLDVAAIPGEIYPELVLGKVQDPPDAGADFPKAAIEPALYRQLPGPYRMIVGLANDEVGYIIPKRQWDEKPPFCYGRKKSQYGEINSLGPNTAPLLCNAFRDLVKGKK